MPFNPPIHHPGDPVKADDVNAQNAELRRLGRIRGGAGVVVRQGSGTVSVALSLPETIIIRLTSTYSGGYSWEEMVHVSANTWTTTGRTGSRTVDPAFERQTGDTTLTVDGTRYEARRAAPSSPSWVFDGKH